MIQKIFVRFNLYILKFRLFEDCMEPLHIRYVRIHKINKNKKN